jgi:flagellar biosynthesis protein FlhF
MKIKRFYAATMREAIRMVREEQGPDAVILSNQTTPEGIEVVAAVDYDASLIQQVGKRPPPAAPAGPDAGPAGDERETLLPRLDSPQNRPAAPAAPASQAARLAASAAASAAASSQRRREPPESLLAAVPPAGARPQANTVDAAGNLLDLQREIAAMRAMIEQQVAGQLWGDMQKYRPSQAAALRALAELGIEPPLAREIAEQVPNGVPLDRARFLPLGLLGRRIPHDATDPVLEGGVIALVGPTGVGKTTTIAKLAARYAAEHGTRDLALVTTDGYRVGAQEQLFIYGRLLGAPVYTVSQADPLPAILKRLSDRKLVLIDTAGVSQRDRQLSEEIQRLAAIGPTLKSYLVLATNAQPASQEEAVDRFGKLPLAGCILTKLDEADRTGGSLSIAIRRQLPVAYYADGQRVPEDLHPARSDRLVLRAMQLARRTPAPVDDQTLAAGFTVTQPVKNHAHG